jgi:integrase/recombinase XerD
MDPSPAGSLLERAAMEHEAWLAGERGVSRNTVTAYRRDLASWIAHLHGRGRLAPDDVLEEDVTAYLEVSRGVHGTTAPRRARGARRARDGGSTEDVGTGRGAGNLRKDGRREPKGAEAKGLSPATVNRRLAAIRSFHRFCLREGLASSDPTRHVRSGKLPQALPKVITVDDVVRLIEAPDLSSVLGLRDRAMLELLYGCGMRVSELTALDRDDVDLETRTVRCLGKGGRERIVPIGSYAQIAVEAYLVRARPELAVKAPSDRSHPLFLSGKGRRLTRQGMWGIVKSYVERVQLSNAVSPHSLRHACATHMLDGGADIRVVQETLGHARLTTTQVYTAVSQDRLVEAYRSAHPRAGRRAKCR